MINRGYLDNSIDTLDSGELEFDDQFHESFHKAFLKDDVNSLKTILHTNFINCSDICCLRKPWSEYLCQDFYPTLHGCNILHLAVLYCAHNCISELVKNQPQVEIDSVTEEFVTPLHIACSCSDFMSTEILLKANADQSKCDARKRLPIHYAALSEVNCILTLLQNSRSHLNSMDIDGMNPLNIAQRYRKKIQCAFIRSHLSIKDGEIDRMKSFEWITKHLSSYICISPTPSEENPEFCACLEPINSHEILTTNKNFNSLIADRYCKDSNSQIFFKRPTNSFGQIEFASNTILAEFVRLAEDVEIKKIRRLSEKIWCMPRPQLILTMYGNKIIDQSDNSILLRSLWKTAEKTVTWILTNGDSTGIAHNAGEAIKLFQEAHGAGKICGLAISPWRRLMMQKNLRSPCYNGLYPARYPSGMGISATHLNLDPKHSHYLLVDTEGKHGKGCESNFRSKFEKELVNWPQKSIKHSCSDNINFATKITSDKIPICGVLSGGDEVVLEEIHKVFLNNEIPFLILNHTGGLAQILVDCICLLESMQYQTVGIPISERRKQVLSPKIMQSFCEQHLHKISNYPKFIVMLQDMLDYRERFEIFFFDSDGVNEFDGKLLSCLLADNSSKRISQRSAECNQVHDRININHLSIAMYLNRPDVAEKKVFKDQIPWDKQIDEIFPFIMQSLIFNRTKFLEVFLDKGFCFIPLLTYQILEDLYTQTIKYEGINTPEFEKLIIITNKNIPKFITLDLLGRALKYLIGSPYNPLYLQTEFIRKYTASLAMSKKSHKSQNSFDESVSEKEIDTNGNGLNNTFQEPYRELFLWALLTRRIEMAEFFLTQVQDSIPCALFAAVLLRKLTRLSESDFDISLLNEVANKFESYALGVLNSCYQVDAITTKECIIREQPLYGDQSSLILAAMGKSISFISHSLCQDYLDTVWHHTMDRRRSTVQFLFCLGLGICMPPLVPIVMSYREEIYATEFDECNGIILRAPIVKIHSDETPCVIIKESERTRRQKFVIFMQKLRDFYMAPEVRFAYNLIAYISFLIFFTIVLLFGIHEEATDISKEQIFLIYWVMALALEEFRQAVLSGCGFFEYLSELWNALDLFGAGFFCFGLLMLTLTLYDQQANTLFLSILPLKPLFAFKGDILKVSRITLSISLFLFFMRVLQFYCLSKQLGPMIVMIQKMIVRDLGPFMAIFMIFTVAYGVLQWAVTFKPVADLPMSTQVSAIFKAVQLSYFQIFNDLNVDLITGNDKTQECQESGYFCTDDWNAFVPVIMLAVHIVMTSILLTNLLIAMFATTYSEIHEQSIQIWSLQRYHIMREYIGKSPIPPPFIPIWHIFFTIYFLIEKCRGKNLLRYNSFKRSYQEERHHERQLRQWERLRALDYQRLSKSETISFKEDKPFCQGCSVFGNSNQEISYLKDAIIEQNDSMINFQNQIERILAILEHREPKSSINLDRRRSRLTKIESFNRNSVIDEASTSSTSTKRQDSSTLEVLTTLSEMESEITLSPLQSDFSTLSQEKDCNLVCHKIEESYLPTFWLSYIISPGEDLDTNIKVQTRPISDFMNLLPNNPSDPKKIPYSLITGDNFSYILIFTRSPSCSIDPLTLKPIIMPNTNVLMRVRNADEFAELPWFFTYGLGNTGYLEDERRGLQSLVNSFLLASRFRTSKTNLISNELKYLLECSFIEQIEVKMDIKLSEGAQLIGKQIWIHFTETIDNNENLEVLTEIIRDNSGTCGIWAELGTILDGNLREWHKNILMNKFTL